MKIGRKKRVPYWLFCYIVLTEWTFLDQLWAWQQGVFHWIFSKMKCKSCVFERVDVFLTKYVHESRVFREWMIFWQNMGMGVDFFFVKNMRKKCFFVVFLAHYSFDRINAFFYQIYAWQRGRFSWKMWKKLHKSTIFVRMYVFMTK